MPQFVLVFPLDTLLYLRNFDSFRANLLWARLTSSSETAAPVPILQILEISVWDSVGQEHGRNVGHVIWLSYVSLF